VARPRPAGATLRQDGLAGLSTALSDIPDAMATALLAGVSPVHGLYAAMVGPIVGGLLSSSGLMVITTTAAGALTAGQAIAGLAPEARTSALFVIVIVAGAVQVVSGLLRLGRLVRFVSYSVMTGLLTGIAVLIVLGQLPTITGYAPAGDGAVRRTLSLLANLHVVHLPSLGVGALALGLLVGLRRTRLEGVATLAAIAVPSVLVVGLGLDRVEIVEDVSRIPRGLPSLFWPSLSDLTPEVITGALALSVIVLVQGAGVSQSLPDQDGPRASLSRDFIAQGAANLASGFLRGAPVGGSLGASALSVAAGARTRRAPIIAGLCVALIVAAVPGLVLYIAMPTLGALLIFASLRTISLREAHALWRTGWPPILAGAVTFLATLLLPIQVAVGIGAALSAVLFVTAAAADVSVVELVERPDGSIEEREPARRLASNTVTVLDVYGNLFYAGARTLERRLPGPGPDTDHPVVVLRLRGRAAVGATLVEVLSDYARKLEAVNGRLYLSGIGETIEHPLVRAGKLRLTGPVRLYEATPIRGQSTRRAYADAQAWLVGNRRDATAAGSDHGAG
jgi:SulP family sulfate permease